MELARTEIEHKDTDDVEFFILQCSKLRILELYRHFCDETCDIKNFENLEMDENSTLLLQKENGPTVFDPKWKQSGESCEPPTVITAELRIHREVSSPVFLSKARETRNERVRSLQGSNQMFV